MSSKSEDELLRDFHTDLDVGDILRRARLRMELTLEQIEYEIRISKAHLLAIEEGRFEALPGRIYTLGFIRTYAEHLGLDGEKMMALLRRQSGPKIEPKPMALPQDQVSEDISIPQIKTLFSLFLMLAIIIVIAPYITGRVSFESKQVPALPHEMRAQLTLLSKPVAPPVPAVVSPATNGNGEISTAPPMAATVDETTVAQVVTEQETVHPVVLRAVSNVWLEIRSSDRRTLFSRVLKSGEEYWVPADQKGLVMTLGNAGGLRIIVEGQELPFLGLTGQVVKNIRLDPAPLKERLKIPAKRTM